MIKKMIRKIAHAKTFFVQLVGLDTGFSVINGLLTHKTAVRKKTDFAAAKSPSREAITVPIQPLTVQTLRPSRQLAAQPITERPLRRRSG